MVWVDILSSGKSSHCAAQKTIKEIKTNKKQMHGTLTELQCLQHTQKNKTNKKSQSFPSFIRLPFKWLLNGVIKHHDGVASLMTIQLQKRSHWKPRSRSRGELTGRKVWESVSPTVLSENPLSSVFNSYYGHETIKSNLASDLICKMS